MNSEVKQTKQEKHGRDRNVTKQKTLKDRKKEGGKCDELCKETKQTFRIFGRQNGDLNTE